MSCASSPDPIRSLFDLYFFLDPRCLFLLYSRLKIKNPEIQCFQVTDIQEKKESKSKKKNKGKSKNKNKKEKNEKEKEKEEEKNEDKEISEIEFDEEELMLELAGIFDSDEDGEKKETKKKEKQIQFQMMFAHKVRVKYASTFWLKLPKKSLDTQDKKQNQSEFEKDISFESNSIFHSFMTSSVQEWIQVFYQVCLGEKKQTIKSTHPLATSRAFSKQEIKEYLFEWSRAWMFGKQPPFVSHLYLHLEPVLCACVSPNQAWLATFSLQKGLHIYKQDNGLSIPWCFEKVFQNPLRQFHLTTCLQFSSNSQFLAQGLSDGSVQVWNLSRASVQFSLQGWHEKAVSALDMCFKNEYLLTGSFDSTIALWKASSSTPLRVFRCSRPIQQMTFHPSYLFFGVLEQDGRFSFWSIESFEKPLFEISQVDCQSFCFTGSLFQQICFTHTKQGALSFYTFSFPEEEESRCEVEKKGQIFFESFSLEGISVGWSKVVPFLHQHSLSLVAVVWQQNYFKEKSNMKVQIIECKCHQEEEPTVHFESSPYQYSDRFQRLLNVFVSHRNQIEIISSTPFS